MEHLNRLINSRHYKYNLKIFLVSQLCNFYIVPAILPKAFAMRSTTRGFPTAIKIAEITAAATVTKAYSRVD